MELQNINKDNLYLYQNHMQHLKYNKFYLPLGSYIANNLSGSPLVYASFDIKLIIYYKNYINIAMPAINSKRHNISVHPLSANGPAINFSFSLEVF